MGNKSKMKQRPQRIVKNTNPNVARGAITLVFDLTKGFDGQLLTIQVKACTMNGFAHNHDAANEWLGKEAGPLTVAILRQAVTTADAVVAARAAPEKDLPPPEAMHGAEVSKPE